MTSAAAVKGKPGKIGPAASRFLYSRPPLRDSTPVMRDSKSKAKPSEGTPEGPVDRGSAADYFGASPVASALNLPRERDSPKNRKQTTTHSSPARSKPDISTLQGIGHFYFALTNAARVCQPATISPIPVMSDSQRCGDKMTPTTILSQFVFSGFSELLRVLPAGP